MRLLTRYVIVELLTIFLLTLAGMTALIFVALIGKEAVDKGLGLGPLVRMVPYLVPQAMQFAVPGTMLLATTSVYGRMAASNEVVALKSMGISPWSLVTPTLILASLVSLGAVMLNDVAVSWGRMGSQRVFIESLEEVIYGQLRVHRTYSHDTVNINVRRVEGRKLVQPTVTYIKEGVTTTVWAQWAELQSLKDSNEVIIRLHNFEVDGPKIAFVDSETHEETISLSALIGTGGRSTSTYALSEIKPALARQTQHLGSLREDQTAQAAIAMITGEMEQISSVSWEPTEQEIGHADFTMHRLKTEPFRRWANGFSCLAFVMVGVPVSIIFRKGEFLASFFMCFAPILLVYYPMLMVSVDKAKGGALPPASVWVGNLVLALAGLYLMRRVIRY